ncbi:MAG TPA: hypothetical protein ENN22_00030 [bacterium]|nr:hypothetical protein [bacterium]
MSEKRIGHEIEAFCGKCKSDTFHQITSVEGDKITKVMCKVCMSHHKYKPSQQPTESAPIQTKKSAPAAPTKRRTRRDKWSRLLDNSDQESAIDYQISDSYEIATAINHKTFGLGVVKNIIDSRKIEVLFQDGEKILIQNYSTS